MNINATLYGQYVIVFAIIMGLVCYYVARGKVQQPVVAGLLGAVLSVIPIFGVIYLVILLFKKDTASTSLAATK